MSDVQKLIAEARSKANDPNDYPPAILLTELCDALEDASRAASRIWADGARAALLSEGYAVVDDAAVLLQNPHGATTPVEPEGDVVERVARHLAHLDEGDRWPGNSELDGSLTGTRDDEYRAAMLDEAREILALVGFSRPADGEEGRGSGPARAELEEH